MPLQYPSLLNVLHVLPKIMFPWFFDKWTSIIKLLMHVLGGVIQDSAKTMNDKKKPFYSRHVCKIFCMFDSHSYINIFMFGRFKNSENSYDSTIK